jgi:hypothetical protein
VSKGVYRYIILPYIYWIVFSNLMFMNFKGGWYPHELIVYMQWYQLSGSQKCKNNYTRLNLPKKKLKKNTTYSPFRSAWVHLSVLSGVCVTRSLVLCVYFVDRCLSFCHFSFGHCVICPSIYGFWLPLWYLQTLLLDLIMMSCSR